jgi:hypothetical protein
VLAGRLYGPSPGTPQRSGTWGQQPGEQAQGHSIMRACKHQGAFRHAWDSIVPEGRTPAGRAPGAAPAQHKQEQQRRPAALARPRAHQQYVGLDVRAQAQVCGQQGAGGAERLCG